MSLINDKTQLRYLKMQKHRFIWRQSLSLLLLLVKQAQRESCRSNYYKVCYFFSILEKVKERCFWLTQWDGWKFSNICVVTDLFDFLSTMEYHLEGVIWSDFSSDYFYPKKLDSSLMLKFKDFFLRLDTATFMIFWTALAYMRMALYNQYVKNHFFTIDSKYIYLRKANMRTIRRLGVHRILTMRAHFFLTLLDQRYRIIKFRSHSLPLQPTADLGLITLLQQNRNYMYMQGFGNFSWKSIVNNGDLSIYFKKFYYNELYVMANALLAYQGQQFMEYTRLDYETVRVLSGIFAINPWTRYWWYKLWTIVYYNKFFENFYCSAPVQNFYLVKELCKLNKALTFDHSYRFAYYVWSLLISNYFNYFLLRMLHWVRLYKDTGQGYAHWYSQKPLNTRLNKFTIFGPFNRVDLAFTRGLFGLEYYLWRIWNPDSEYDFNEGRLDFPLFIRKVDLDLPYQSKVISLSSVYFIFLTKIKMFIPQQPRRPHFMHHALFSKLRERDDRLLKMSKVLLMRAVDTLLISLYTLSLPLSYLTYFLLVAEDKPTLHLFNIHQAGCLMMPAVNNVAHVKRICIYKEEWNDLRRYPNQIGVHSKNPMYRETWLRFANRMRRAGILITDLPYYRATEDIDIITDLHKITHDRGYLELHTRMWVIKKDEHNY